MRLLKAWSVVFSLCVISAPALAERTVRNSSIHSGIRSVCAPSQIRQIGRDFFYKNNKPIRGGPRLDVIGQNPVITLAGQPFRGPRIFRGPGTLHAINGTRLATLAPYPCKSDHCTGRVVSSTNTAILRRAAIRAAKSEAGYIKVGGVCVYIPDIGRCFGDRVNMGRPLCDRTLR